MPVVLEDRIQPLDMPDRLTLWRVREIVAHRRINSIALSEVLGRTEQWIRSVLNLSVPMDTEQRRATWRDWMDRIDDAIDQITLTRGGLSACCGCSASAIGSMSEILHAARGGEGEV